jgi:hypothetical protein
LETPRSKETLRIWSGVRPDGLVMKEPFVLECETQCVAGLPQFADARLESVESQPFRHRLRDRRNSGPGGRQVNARMRFESGILNEQQLTQTPVTQRVPATVLRHDLVRTLLQRIGRSDGIEIALAAIQETGRDQHDEKEEDRKDKFFHGGELASQYGPILSALFENCLPLRPVDSGRPEWLCQMIFWFRAPPLILRSDHGNP